MMTFLYLVFCFFLVAFVIKRPSLSLPLIIFLTMVFERFFTLTPFVFGDYILKIYPLDIVLIFSAIVYFKNGYFKNLKFGFLELMIVIFIIISAANFFRAYFTTGTDIENAFSSFKNYAFYAIIYFLTLISVQKTSLSTSDVNILTSDVDRLKKTFVLGGIFILPLFLIGFITGQPLFGEFTPLSTEGSRALAPSYAFYILIALITLIAYPDIFKTSGSDLNFRPQNFKRNFSFKRFLPLIIWFFVMAILLSLSRHLWLALILGIYLIWRYLVDSRQYILKDIYKPFVAAMVFFILLYLLFSFVLPSYFLNLPNFLNDIKLRFESFFNPEDVSFNYRAALWKESLSYFFTNPLFGIGYGQEITFPVEGTILTAPIRELHNSLYAVLLQMGIVGFLPIFFIVIWCLLRFFRSPDKEKSAYSLTLLILFLFSSLFGTYLEINLLAIFFWIFLAIFKFQIITTRD